MRPPTVTSGARYLNAHSAAHVRAPTCVPSRGRLARRVVECAVMRERRPRPAQSKGARRPARGAAAVGGRPARPAAGKPFRAGGRPARPAVGKPFRAGGRPARPAVGKPFRAGERPARTGSSSRRTFGLRPEGGSWAPDLRSPRRRSQAGTKSRNTKNEKGLGRSAPVRSIKHELPRDIEKVLNRQPWDLLTPHLLRAGADIVEVLPRIRRFAEFLLEWNRGFSNLISTSDEDRLVQRHILESLEPAHWIKSSGARRWLDFGSGGGLPALPLALAGVGESWTLVESRRNKTLFLRKMVQEFELTNIDVELARLELLPAEMERLGRFDGFTSRATLRLGPTLTLAADWVPAGGLAYLWKGSRMEQEMVQDPRWKAFWNRDDVFAIGNGQTVVARFVRRTS